MKKTFISLFLLLFTGIISAQVPQSFAYQAAIRNAEGEPIKNQAVAIKVSLLTGSLSGGTVYSEIHSVVSSAQGTINLTIGNGSTQFGLFANIPWNEAIFAKIAIDLAGGTSFVEMGGSQILSVPYALKAGGLAKGPVEVSTSTGQNTEAPIFVVKNSTGAVVFAVYESGTRVYIDKSDGTKGARGGFAIGGIGDDLKDKTAPKYLTIEPDSVRFNIEQNAKGARGGFAIGGIGDDLKNPSMDYLYIRPDSIRFAIDETQVKKGARGGFAIGGIGDDLKGFSNYFFVNQDCTYVSNNLNAAGNVVVTGNVLTGGTIGTLPTPPVVDLDGNSYQTTRIGNQIWMAENLRAITYNDSTLIMPSLALDGTHPYIPYFEGTGFLDPLEWGYLYSLSEINYTDKNICPTGWRLPTNEDWNTLISNATAAELIDNTPGLWQGIKSNSKTTGFKAKPAGQFEFEAFGAFNPPINPIYYSINMLTKFWSQPEDFDGTDASKVYTIEWMSGNFSIYSNYEYFYTAPEYYRGYSIRCIKNSNP